MAKMCKVIGSQAVLLATPANLAHLSSNKI